MRCLRCFAPDGKHHSCTSTLHAACTCTSGAEAPGGDSYSVHLRQLFMLRAYVQTLPAQMPFTWHVSSSCRRSCRSHRDRLCRHCRCCHRRLPSPCSRCRCRHRVAAIVLLSGIIAVVVVHRCRRCRCPHANCTRICSHLAFESLALTAGP